MAFYESKIDSNSVLASKLKGKHYPSKTNFFNVQELIKVDTKSGKLIENLVKVFYPEHVDDEDFTPVMVTAKQGAFDRIYGPIVAVEDNQIVLSAGLVQVPLNVKEGVITGTQHEIEVDIINSNFNGYDDTLVFSLVIFKPTEDGEDLTISYELPIKFRKLKKDEKYPSQKEFSTMLKRKPKDLLSWLGAPPKPPMPTIAAKQLPVDDYAVIGYSFFTTFDNRESGAMVIKGNVDESGLTTQEYIDPDDASRETYIPLEMVSVYIPKELMGPLKLNPIVSEEYPATFSIRSVTPGKKANSFRVDSGFLLNPNAPQVESEEEEDLSFLEL